MTLRGRIERLERDQPDDAGFPWHLLFYPPSDPSALTPDERAVYDQLFTPTIPPDRIEARLAAEKGRPVSE
jgi:hypothetical protein